MLNEEIIPLICRMLEEYPLAEPQDVVKLLYQREFGPGHAVGDPALAALYAAKEYAECVQEDGPLMEYIGGGRARLNLKRLDANGMTPEKAAELFVKSASPAGDKTAFADMLRELSREGFVQELCPSLPAYIEDYIAMGCPAVHHSEAYRNAYRPAYRVVDPRLI